MGSTARAFWPLLACVALMTSCSSAEEPAHGGDVEARRLHADPTLEVLAVARASVSETDPAGTFDVVVRDRGADRTALLASGVCDAVFAVRC